MRTGLLPNSFIPTFKNKIKMYEEIRFQSKFKSEIYKLRIFIYLPGTTGGCRNFWYWGKNVEFQITNR